MRQARGMKLLAVASVAIATLGMAACGTTDSPGGDNTSAKKLKVGMAYDIGGRGDKSFNDSAAAGLDRVKNELSIETRELNAVLGESENDKYARLKILCDAGFNPIIAVGFIYAGADAKNGPIARAAKDCPNTKFAIIDDASATAPNVANLIFAEEQGSFLVGAAAALKSKANHVGFIGGCTIDLIKKFEAGFIAGAKKVNPSIQVTANYLSTPAQQCSGFNDPGNGESQANGIFDKGADVIYHAAGGSGTGLFKAAAAKNKLAIGVDSDQYEKETDAKLKNVIITSMLKRIDVAVFNFVKDMGEDKFTAGTKIHDLKVDGVGYATTGGKVDDIKTKLDEYKQQIIAGTITVPTTV